MASNFSASALRTGHALGLLVLRAAAGGFMLYAHGWPKLMNFRQSVGHFPDPLHIGPVASQSLATGAEVLGAALVVLGLATRPAALAVTVTMLVAAFAQHAADPFAKKELALLYAAMFAAVALAGPGPLSLGALLRRRAGRGMGRAPVPVRG